jgi:hypothetical protein
LLIPITHQDLDGQYLIGWCIHISLRDLTKTPAISSGFSSLFTVLFFSSHFIEWFLRKLGVPVACQGNSKSPAYFHILMTIPSSTTSLITRPPEAKTAGTNLFGVSRLPCKRRFFSPRGHWFFRPEVRSVFSPRRSRSDRNIVSSVMGHCPDNSETYAAFRDITL